MLTVYGVLRSRTSRIVWLCHELGLPFRHVPVIQVYRLRDPDAPDAPLHTRSESFLKLSPAGAVPVIQDGDLVLSESLACTLYLARKHGGPLGPADLPEDALMMQWSFYGVSAIEADALAIMFRWRPGATLSAPDQAAVDEAAQRLERPLKVLEDHLAANTHLVGGRFTVADLNMAEMLRYAQGYTPLMERFPAIMRWLGECQSRPAFQQMWKERAAEPE